MPRLYTRHKVLPIKYNDRGSYIEYLIFNSISFVAQYDHSLIIQQR